MPDSIQFLSPSVVFESSYLALRDKENRVLNDEQVKLLPQLPSHLPHAKEWQMRKATADRFLAYLGQHSFVGALDIGCGNGWFSNAMASQVKGKITGLDINEDELKQGHRVFGSEKLSFCYGDIFQEIFPHGTFDLITLNAAIQYFPDLDQLASILKTLLRPGGEIHVLDSPFYPLSKIPAARQRTLDYYTSMGHPEMADHYHHHSLDAIAALAGKPLYSPSRWRKMLGKVDSPFSWFCIKG